MNLVLLDWYLSTVQSWITDDISSETTPAPLNKLSAVQPSELHAGNSLLERSADSNGATISPVISTFGGTPLHWIAMPALITGIIVSKKYWPVAYRDMPM